MTVGTVENVGDVGVMEDVEGFVPPPLPVNRRHSAPSVIMSKRDHDE
jgi:hypothetical protein